jgi:hypothetical protein
MMRMTSVLAAALVLAACDGDTFGTSRESGSGAARMQVAVRGDDAPPSQSVQGADAGGPAFNHTSAQGTIAFRARVYAQSTTSGWVELTNNAASSSSVNASGHGNAVAFVSSRVEAGSYSRVRVVFQDVDANLTSGIQLDGGLLTGSLSVDLGSDAQVTVEREVSVSASATATPQLVINLNADAWLNQASATTRTVSETAFQAAVQVTAQ